MPRQQLPQWTPRESFEECEERVVFSADPVDAPPPLLMQGAPELVAHIQPGPTGEIDPMTVSNAAGSWSNPHASTGVDHVRETYGFTGVGQTVAVIDSGIAWDHYALGGGLGDGHRVVGGWDFAENDSNPYDDGPAGFHGTHVAGIIGSSDATYRGVAPGVDLVGLRVFDDQGNGNFAWVENALQWVLQHRNDFENPITTVNMSIGASWNSTNTPSWAMLEDEFRNLEQVGIVVTVSAGNSFQQYNAKGLSYPAASPYVIPVASENQAGQMSSFSQRADRALVAPGERIMSTVPDAVYSFDNVPNDFAQASGTSMASPYVAGAAVLVRQAMQAAGQTNITADSIYAALRDTADPLYDSATNTTYFSINVGAAVDSIMQGHNVGGGGGGQSGGNSGGGNSVNVAADWGAVAAGHFDNQSVAGEKWFQVTASQAGLFSVQAGGSVNGVQLSIHDSDHQQLAGSTGANGAARVDVTAKAGDVYFVRIAGNSADVDLTVANLVAQSGKTVTVSGTSGNDTFAYQNGATHVVTAGGVDYSFAKTAITTINFQGGAGNDTLSITGSAAAEKAVLKAGSVNFTAGTAYSVTGAAIEAINIAGGGGADVAQLYDSAGNDTFVGGGKNASLSGTGFANSVTNFGSITAYATGGIDTAQLSDTAGNDTLVMKPTGTTMTGSGYAINLSAFERVTATATSGTDTATIAGTTGIDTITGSPTSVSLTNGNLLEEARGFDTVKVDGAGGVDVANLTGSSGADRFVAALGVASLTGPGYAINLANVETLTAAGGGGSDTAVFSGSKFADLFTARATTANLTSGGLNFTANNFASVTATAVAGGADRANLFDSAGNDTLTARPLDVTLAGATFANAAKSFANVVASASTGTDRATFYDSRGNDTFTSRPGQASMVGSGYNNSAAGFDSARGVASAGLDVANLHDSAGADTLSSQANLTTLTSANSESSAENFRTVKVFGDGGGANAAVFEAMGATESLSGRDNWVTAARGPAKVTAYDFDFVELESQPGAAVRADILAVDYLFERNG